VRTKKSVLAHSVDLAGDHSLGFSAIMSVFLALLLTLRNCARSRAVLQLEAMALRHQLPINNSIALNPGLATGCLKTHAVRLSGTALVLFFEVASGRRRSRARSSTVSASGDSGW